MCCSASEKKEKSIMNYIKRLCLTAVVLVVALSAGAAHAIEWDYFGSDFNDPANWFPNTVPSESTEGATVPEPLDWTFNGPWSDPTLTGPVISQTTNIGSIILWGGGLTIDATGSLSTIGDLNIRNKNNSPSANFNAPGPGALVINHGTAAPGTVINQLQVGNGGRGQLDMMGGRMETNGFSVGRNFGIGVANLFGGVIYSNDTSSQNMLIHTHPPNQGLLFGGDSFVNFEGGTLVTVGNYGATVDAYKEIDLVGTNGGEPIPGADLVPKMIAFGGTGTVEWSYDPLAAGGLGETTIWGVAPPPILLADFNADTVVDGTDFLLWQQDFGTIYDATDLANWEAEFGTSSPVVGAGVAAAVPEPTTAIMLSLGALTLVGIRRRR